MISRDLTKEEVKPGQPLYPTVTKELVMSFDKPTENFLCPLSANHYHIQFESFKIRDYNTNQCFFEIYKDLQAEEVMEQEIQYQFNSEAEEREVRTVRYNFSSDFFNLNSIGTLLKFSVGCKPVKNFMMIERHYFRNKLLQSFEFTFPFCIPNTSNEWEAIYDVPKLDKETIEQMMANPFETKSDSFYFVGNELIMHNKAEYDYSQ